jgi:hypothetical protein
MGCKLHLLIGSLFEVERAGNVLISYNNYAARDAVPLVEQVSSIFSQFSSLFAESSPAFSVEFTPSPVETTHLIAQKYQVRRNLLVQFANDTIDQTTGLSDVLQSRFPGMIATHTLAGTHLTPLGPDVKLQAGSVFTPWDAIAQWMRQEVYRELHQLERTMLRWIDPLGHTSL